MRRKNWELKGVFWIITLLFVGFLAAPILLLLGKSLVGEGGFTWEFYASVVTREGFLTALGNSFAVAAASAVTATVIAFLMAYAEDSPLARREAVTPGDLADSPLILTTRELMRREMIRWFGPYADRIQVAASGNLPYNQTQLAREGLGIYLVIRLDCAYDGLRFVPLSPPLESGTVLAWKKTEVLSATAAALLRFAEKYVGGISDHPV